MNLQQYFGIPDAELSDILLTSEIYDTVLYHRSLLERRFSKFFIQNVADTYRSEIREFLLAAGENPSDRPINALAQFIEYVQDKYVYIMSALEVCLCNAMKIHYWHITDTGRWLPPELWAMADYVIICSYELGKPIRYIMENAGNIQRSSNSFGIGDILDSVFKPIKTYVQQQGADVASYSLRQAVIDNLPILLVIIFFITLAIYAVINY